MHFTALVRLASLELIAPPFRSSSSLLPIPLRCHGLSLKCRIAAVKGHIRSLWGTLNQQLGIVISQWIISSNIDTWLHRHRVCMHSGWYYTLDMMGLTSASTCHFRVFLLSCQCHKLFPDHFIRMQEVFRVAEEYRADGLFCHILFFCLPPLATPC